MPFTATPIASHSPPARAQPRTPPDNAIKLASPTTMPRISPEEKPKVFRIPTSLVRSRTDMESIFAETSRIVNVTAPQMAARNSFKFPKNDTKLSRNACSGSLFVG